MKNTEIKYSFAQWCIDNDHQDWLDRWDYELNVISPDEVAYKSNKKYWFKCPRGIHESELKNICNLTSGRTHLFCVKCSSFGQWFVDNLGEDAIQKYWSEKNAHDWFNIGIRSKKEIWIKCDNVTHPDYKTNPDKFVLGNRCPVCSNKKNIAGINDIATTHPQFVKYFKDKTDATKYSIRSGKYTWFVCPVCGNEKYTNIDAAFHSGHYACTSCGDGVSYGNKFVYCFLKQLQNKYTFILNPEKVFEWSKRVGKTLTKRRYDFYINDGEDMIIEAHGRQHYEHGFDLTCGGRSVEEEQENDLLKYNLAIQNGVCESRYIVLDCRESNCDFIKQSILTSNLPALLHFNEYDIDWERCHQFATSNLVQEACRMWLSGVTALKDIANKLGISTSTASNYLYQGDKLGLIIYESKINKPIVCLDHNYAFVSSSVCSRYSYELFGTFLSRKCINSNANQECETTHGLRFKYITYEEFRKIKLEKTHYIYE